MDKLTDERIQQTFAPRPQEGETLTQRAFGCNARLREQRQSGPTTTVGMPSLSMVTVARPPRLLVT